MQVSDKFRFLHISDIHFHKNSGDAYDPDNDLRSQVEIDCKRLERELGSFSGIFITGDIAFSAEADQYVKAKEWITRLSGILGSDSAKVWPIPGNHDVDREITSAISIKNLHAQIRSLNPASFDAELPGYLRDTGYQNMFYEPLKEYIKFAGIYGCEISPKFPIWIDQDLSFTDGTIISIRGLNTVLVSNKKDNTEDNKLFIGSHQLNFEESPNMIHLTLGHHPPDWLMDKEYVSNKLSIKSHIGLFGHKHEQWISPEDEGEINYLHITAGAVHPDRRESGWVPRFNILELSIENKNGNRYLCLKVYSRIFSESQLKFVQDDIPSGGNHRKYFIKLEPLITETTKEDNMEDKSENVEIINNNDISLKVLRFKFLELNFNQIVSIGTKLDLITNEDRSGLRDYEFIQNIIDRAIEKDILRDLYNEVLRKD